MARHVSKPGMLRRFNLAHLPLVVLLLVGACVPVATSAPGTSTVPTAILEFTETPGVPVPRPLPPIYGKFDAISVSQINLADYVVIPAINPTMRVIYQAGLARDNNPHVFTKLGDSMTDNPHFLVPLSAGDYDLGEFGYLQETIHQFAGFPARGQGWTLDSFATIGSAAAQGFNVAGLLDPTWANPKWCEGGESPLACDDRVSRSSIAVIMFGTNVH